MELEFKYRVLIGISAMVILFVSFLISFITAQRKKLKFASEMERMREMQQNQLLEAAIKSEEVERHRIAETLHDEVGAILSSAKIHLVRMKSKGFDNADVALHSKTKELMDDVIQKVRHISHSLHSTILQEFGLNDAIEHFVKKVTEQNAISATCNLDEVSSDGNTETDMSIYRVIQELINNILKHSSASHLDISSIQTDSSLRFSISHDGLGITNEDFRQMRQNKAGMGLKNIQNRIALLRGKIDFTRQPSSYRISFEVPKRA